MQCHKCDVRLKVVRTVTAGPAGRTQEADCPKCGGRYTCVTLILSDSEGYGNGAAAVAKRVRNGQISLETNK
jgi:hypothetical protein